MIFRLYCHEHSHALTCRWINIYNENAVQMMREAMSCYVKSQYNDYVFYLNKLHFWIIWTVFWMSGRVRAKRNVSENKKLNQMKIPHVKNSNLNVPHKLYLRYPLWNHFELIHCSWLFRLLKITIIIYILDNNTSVFRIKDLANLSLLLFIIEKKESKHTSPFDNQVRMPLFIWKYLCLAAMLCA